MRYEKLLSPIVVRGKILKNRMSSSNSLPHFLQGPEPYPADGVIAHFANRAKSGAAVVTCMGINNFSRGAGLPAKLDIAHFPDYDLYDPTCQNYLIQLADAIHFHEAVACMGFFVGPQSGYPLQRPDGSVELVRAENPLPPMPFPGVDMAREERAYYARAKEAVGSVDRATMEKIAESCAQQCGILKWLGFDMASLHFAYRGQIPTKFLSPLTNARTDEYGGSLENRAKFPLMILKRIRETVGDDFIVEILLSGEEPEGGYGREDAAAFIKMAEPYADIAQVRAADADPNHPTGFNLEETPFLELAEYMKKQGVKMLIGNVGGWHDPETAEKALRENKLDIVSMARAWVSNPDYGTKVYEGRRDDIVPCLRCNKCHGRGLNDTFASICSVNPLIGIEHRLAYLLSPKGPAKRVAVVGGGPAGMKAAMDLCDRSHAVTLFEATDELGGAIKHADFIDFKWPLRDFKRYLIHQIGKRNIELRLGTTVTPADIKDGGYDAVVVAIGAVPLRPPIPGADGANVVFAQDAIANADKLGARVVVVGGGEVGMEAGMFLAGTGRDVTVLEMRDELAADSTRIHYLSMFQEAWERLKNLHPIVNARCTEIRAKEVLYTDKDGAEHSLPADSTVLSAGMKAKQAEALAFYGAAAEFYPIGDCRRPATVQETMRSAFAAAGRI